MTLFNKSDMQFKNYQWTIYPKDDPSINGKPDGTRFNRHEGYEVLYIINTLAGLWRFRQIKTCLLIEKMIKEKLPSTTITQIDVKEWIETKLYN